MPRCQTCREKFIGGFNQKNCDKNEECRQAEIDLKEAAQQKRIDKARGKQKDKPQGVLKIVNNLSPEAVSRFKKEWEKNFKGIPKDRPKLILVNKKEPKPFTAKKSSPKKLSAKQAAIESDYKKMLRVYDENTEPVCTGCGKYQGGDMRLSHSHIISRADCKRYGRPDLISDPRNIAFHCLDFGDNIGCHGRHEKRDKTLLDWDKKLKFIYQICVEIENDELLNKLILE